MFRRFLPISRLISHHIHTKQGNNFKLFNLNVPSIERFYCKSAYLQDWIASLDAGQQKKFKLIQNELTVEKSEGRRVPDLENLTEKDYMHLLEISRSQRIKYYNYLYLLHLTEQKDKLKSEIRRVVRQEQLQMKAESSLVDDPNQHIQYGLGKGSMFIKIYPRQMDKWRNHKVYKRMILNDSKLIFDCSFSKMMNNRENKNAAEQITRCFGLNRDHKIPFVLHLTGLDPDSSLWYHLLKFIPTLSKKALPVCLHQEDFSEIVPKERLVYLCPDSDVDLDAYNADDHYVIGAIVDRGDKKPLTLAKAKKLGIRTARMPLYKYRTLRGNKALTLDQMTKVMLDVRQTGQWNAALRHIANRKFY